MNQNLSLKTIFYKQLFNSYKMIILLQEEKAENLFVNKLEVLAIIQDLVHASIMATKNI